MNIISAQAYPFPLPERVQHAQRQRQQCDARACARGKSYRVTDGRLL